MKINNNLKIIAGIVLFCTFAQIAESGRPPSSATAQEPSQLISFVQQSKKKPFNELYLEWRTSVLGTTIDWDKALGNQCVDVANHYYHKITSVKPLIKLASAKQFMDKPELFVNKTPYKLSDTPVLGSLAIWGSNMGNGDGHIAVVDSIREDSITVIEQDGLDPKTVVSLKDYSLTGDKKPVKYLIINIEEKTNSI